MPHELNDYERMIANWFKNDSSGMYIASRVRKATMGYSSDLATQVFGEMLMSELYDLFLGDYESRPHILLQCIYETVLERCDWTKIAEEVRKNA